MGPNKNSEFIDIWAHDSAEEKSAVTKTISCLFDACINTDAHIYHYNAYEVNALRKLSQKYGVMENELDALLRANRFIDLYPIVAKNLTTSEKGVSLKDIEVFFLPNRRDQDVQNAASSVVMYEKWIETKDDNILQHIKEYNEQDCRSLPYLRDWLIKSVLPANYTNRSVHSVENISTEPRKEPQINVLNDVAEYHKREGKPYWWSYFDATTASDEDLILDSAVLAACEKISLNNDENSDNSNGYFFTFPDQEHKFSLNDNVVCIQSPDIRNNSRATITSIDKENRILELTSNRFLENK